MSQYPQPYASRIETSLPPTWKRHYAAQPPEEDDDDFANGPDPLVRIVRSSRRAQDTHYGPRNHYGSEYSRMNFVRRGTTDIPELASPLPHSGRRRESHISYPVIAPVHEGLRHIKKKVVTEPQLREASVEEKDIELPDPDTPRGYRREFQLPVVERDERPAYSEATYSDFENENHVFYSFGDLLRPGGRRDSQVDGSISDIESTAVPDEGNEESPNANATERGAAAYHVLESQYAGDGYEAGHHSARLTAVLTERAAVSQSLFRWM